jgi:hypothetical protein
MLGCRGDLVASPRTGVIVARDVAGNLNRAEAFLAELERGSAMDAELSAGAPPAPPIELACDAVAPVAPPNLASGATAATGSAAGDVLLGLATGAHTEIVVGCGGDRPAFYRPPPAVTLEAAARSLGLAARGPLAFTSAGVAAELARLAMRASQPARPVLLRTFPTAHFEDLETAARALGSVAPGAILVYAPKQLLVAMGTREELAQIAELVGAWGAPRITPAK